MYFAFAAFSDKNAERWLETHRFNKISFHFFKFWTVDWTIFDHVVQYSRFIHNHIHTYRTHKNTKSTKVNSSKNSKPAKVNSSKNSKFSTKSSLTILPIISNFSINHHLGRDDTFCCMQLCALQVNFQHTKNVVQHTKTVVQLRYDRTFTL